MRQQRTLNSQVIQNKAGKKRKKPDEKQKTNYKII